MLDDKLLIWQFNRGRVEALHQIYEKYKHDLVTLAASLLTDLALAEDVVHDVFIGFIQSSGRFQLTGSLKGYLSTCVANAAKATPVRIELYERQPVTVLKNIQFDVPMANGTTPARV